jgi:DNA processing protein
MFTSTETALWNRGIISSLDEANAMVNPANYKMTTVTPLQLLGPLNDVERKYAPSKIFTAGPMKMPLPKPRAAIIGSRKASERGLATAIRIAKTLTDHGVVIISGLAEGIDTMAHETAISEGGRTIAVLGTPLNRTYPQKNLQLQNEIMKNHLAISQFPIGYPIQRKNFVIRNRTMALISNASIIVEAGDTSGSLHQGWEALRLGRPLFIWKSIVNDTSLSWPEKMMRYGATVLNDPKQVLEVLPSSKGLSEIVLQVPKRAHNAS